MLFTLLLGAGEGTKHGGHLLRIRDSQGKIDIGSPVLSVNGGRSCDGNSRYAFVVGGILH